MSREQTRADVYSLRRTSRSCQLVEQELRQQQISGVEKSRSSKELRLKLFAWSKKKPNEFGGNVNGIALYAWIAMISESWLKRPALIGIAEFIFEVSQESIAHASINLSTTDAIENAFNSRTLFQCCQINVPPDLLPDLLSAEFRARYDFLQLELSTPNPVYCSNRSCASFVPPSQARGPDAMDCSRCGAATCRHCRQRSHVGTECVADVQTQQARALAAAEGWKACPSCTNMVEKSRGCYHMTCRCGTEFCYRCGNLYSRCRSTCHEG